MDETPTERAGEDRRRAAASGPSLAEGAVLAGRYRILELLGRGGMGEVYRAADQRLGQAVAVKLLPAALAGDPVRRARLVEEVKIARRVSHPHVCRVHDVGEAEGSLFLSMELVDGEDLASLLARIGRLPADKAVELGRQLAGGLAAVHAEGVLHRDLKPANLMIDGRGRARITDFGIAAPVADTAAKGGTLAYMAPELLAGGTASAASDLYAFGLVLYEMLTGRRPFAARSKKELARLHREAAPPDPGSLVEGLEPAVERLVLRCLHKDPGARPGSAAEVLAALQGGDAALLGWRPAAGSAVPRRDHWRLARRLGEGGFGEVWLARHDKTGEPRVFKFCHDAARLRALEREITLFRLLKEELGERGDIARILDWSFDAPPWFLESEHSECGNLAEWAESRGGIARVPLAQRLELVAQVATALAAAHSVGVLHQDVKPSNVLIAAERRGRSATEVRAQLADFGIGALTQKQRLAAAGITALGWSSETATADAAGTRLYMAPELLEGKRATLQADVYALGVMLYQVVVADFSRALAPGWRRDVEDEVLREDIAAAVEGSPERRLGNALRLAERLRALPERRAERREQRRARRAAERARKALERGRRRRRLALAVVAVSLLFAAAMGELARRVAREASRAREIARVAVAGEWLAKDPTRAALVLLEVERPDETPFAASKMRQVLTRELAVLELADPGGALRAAAFSPDGGRVATAAADGAVRIWRTDGGAAPVVLAGHRQAVLAVAFSPDGGRLVSASEDATARLWRVGGGEATVLAGHRDAVVAVSFSPDGERVLTASADGTARLWHLDSGAATVLEHGEAVVSAAFDPTGERVVTTSLDRAARVWWVGGRSVEHAATVLASDEAWVLAASFDPRGERLLTGHSDGTARIWQVGSDPSRPAGAAVVLSGHGGPVWAVSFSADGERLVTASADGTARLWRADGSGSPTVLAGHELGLRSAAFSADGERLLTASRDGTARVWMLRAGPRGSGSQRVLRGHGGPVVAASFHPGDDHRVLTLSWDGTARLWRPGGASYPTRLTGHGGPVVAAEFSPGGERLVTASRDGTARVWTRDGGGAGTTAVLAGHRGAVLAASFAADGQRLVTASVDGTARVWPADGRGAPKVLAGHRGAVLAARFDGRGGRVVTASEDGTARVWRLRSAVPGSGHPGSGHPAVAVLEGHTGAVLTASFSPDGKRVLTASADGTARLWPADAAGAPRVLAGHEGPVSSAELSPGGERVVTASGDGTARIWPVAGGSPILLAGHYSAVWMASFSADGQRVVTASEDGTARVWPADGSGAPVVLEGPGPGLLSARFSPDGQRVVTAAEDGVVHLWNADGMGVPVVLAGHGDSVRAASFSPDGGEVLTASADGTARLWRLDTAALVDALRRATRICLAPEFRRTALGEPAAAAGERFRECRRRHRR